ncbi:hypothetical protein NECAME_07931 [Necator americanus]|uniref:DUF4440 domain-containing protein n=1 Tax=Necator americanus TaxID=51031 RepID=W2TMX6_NECAM|nr:hypothetical protein NECAME_07931 [Necator americanus]ETN82486.1 hypothetical protein NECAME_07931 [Necator americanus]
MSLPVNCYEFLRSGNSFTEAKSILKPIFDRFTKAFDEEDFEQVTSYYAPNAVLVQIGKKGVYGREAIKEATVEYSKRMGRTKTKISGECYQMTGDYIIITANYEATTEKMGVVKGKFTQIWRKSNNTYLILHDEFTM